MRSFTFAILFLAVVSVQATSASAQNVEFRGAFTITNLNQACKDVGWVLGDVATARFTPPRLGSNGPSTRLSYFFRFFSENYTLPRGKLTSKFKKVNGNGIGRSHFSFTSRMRLTKLSPRNIRNNTTFIDMTGQFQDFDGVKDCDITFRGTFTRRV